VAALAQPARNESLPEIKVRSGPDCTRSSEAGSIMPSRTHLLPLSLDSASSESPTPSRFRDEETFVADRRVGLSPSQCVDLKLAELLRLPAHLVQPRPRMIPGVR
jgi:hypothetical protein